jgi:hypothetical protein
MNEWQIIYLKKWLKFKISKIFTFLLLFVIFGSIFSSNMGIPYVNGEITENDTRSSYGTRGNNDIYLEYAKLVGIFSDDKAKFHLNISLYINIDNATVKIPLIGPPSNAMVNNLSVDNLKRDVRFNSDYYYFTDTLSMGHHYLNFHFSSKILDEGKIDLNFTLYGSILNYLIEFTIPKNSNEKFHIIESSNGNIIEKSDHIIINWEYYAANTINWNLEWIKFKLPTPNDISCDFNAEVLITDKKAIFEVDYSLEFPGFAIGEIEFPMNSETIIISTNKGTIESYSKKVIINLDTLTYEKINLKLVFEKKFGNDLEISIPRPLKSKIDGEVAIFSALNVVVDLKIKENSILVSYSGSMKKNANFIGNYHVTDISNLHFEVLVKESMVTAEIIDTLYPTFEGYNIETWILFTFFGNSPNSITIDFPPLHINGKPQKPLILIDSDIHLPVLDYNWNSNLNRLTLWLYSNITDEYKIGLKWVLHGNNVSMSDLKITDASILNYHVIYYLEQGVIFNHITQSGLSRSGYDSIPLRLRENVNSGTNLEVYNNVGEYYSKLSIEKSTDLKSEIFLRVWVDDLIFQLHQIIRVTSDYMITGIFTFVIPQGVSSISVSNCASWTKIGDHLIIYPTGTAVNYMTFIINAKLSIEYSLVNPFIPQNLGETRIYTMFGSSTNLNPDITPTNAEPMNPDELPKYFLNEIKTQKAVLMYYSQDVPSFEIVLEKFEMEEPPTTIIEFAQITIIRSLDGKVAVRATYMVKNSNRVVLHVRLPPGGVVWMVLVGGKTVPIIQKDELLTITLLRSTITGQNIAFPVEIVYLTTDLKINLEFVIPKVDVEILNLKVNIGLPSSLMVEDPLEYNPNFELDGRDSWSNKIDDINDLSDSYIDQADIMKRELNQVSYDKDVKEPDTVYIGLKDHSSYSDNTINIRRINDKPGTTYSSYNINSMPSFIDPISNNTYVKLNLDQGQYVLSNSGNERQVTVMGGNYQQVLFDYDDDVVFTDIPPIYLQLPESGQVIRLSAIFIKPNENISIKLVEGELDDETSKDDLISFLSSPTSLMIIIIWILVIIIILNLIRHRKDDQDSPIKSKQKTEKRKKRSVKSHSKFNVGKKEHDTKKSEITKRKKEIQTSKNKNDKKIDL